MFLNPRADLFNFKFTRDFIPAVISNKYEPYLNKVAGCPISRAIDYVNYGIQGINLPGLSFDSVEQVTMYGWTKKHRTSVHPQELMSKEMTVTIRMFDGFVNYWIMWDILRYYYESTSPELRYIPDQRVEILDSDGNVTVSVNLKRILYNSLSELSLNFSNNNPEFLTFDINLIYNELELVQSFDSVH